jgi:hypothetical protein
LDITTRCRQAEKRERAVIDGLMKTMINVKERHRAANDIAQAKFSIRQIRGTALAPDPLAARGAAAAQKSLAGLPRSKKRVQTAYHRPGSPGRR